MKLGFVRRALAVSLIGPSVIAWGCSGSTRNRPEDQQ
jgi:hypothetical protein